MIKAVINRIIQLKNPNFQLHPDIHWIALIQLIITKGAALARSYKLLLFGRRPTLLFLERGVSFFNLRKIKMGNWVQLERGVSLSAFCSSGVILGNNVRIGAYSRIIASTDFSNPGVGIKIGNNVGIGEYAYLGGAGGLEIGDNSIIGQYFSCHPENHSFELNGIPYRLQGVSRVGISIGQNCWIGTKVTILDGVKVGNNCVLAAGAVITKNIPDNAVVAGVPAKVIKYISPTTNTKEVCLQNAQYC